MVRCWPTPKVRATSATYRELKAAVELHRARMRPGAHKRIRGLEHLDKIISVMRPGDWLIMQFGHNDQKQMAAGTGGPFTTYPEEMRRHIAAARAAHAVRQDDIDL